LDEEVIALILAFSIADDELQLTFSCPEAIVNHTDIQVYTDEEIQKARLEDMTKELEKVKEKMKEVEEAKKEKMKKEVEEAKKEVEEAKKEVEETKRELAMYRARKSQKF